MCVLVDRNIEIFSEDHVSVLTFFTLLRIRHLIKSVRVLSCAMYTLTYSRALGISYCMLLCFIFMPSCLSLDDSDVLFLFV